MFFCGLTSDKIEARNEALTAKVMELTAKNSALDNQAVEAEKQAAKVGGRCMRGRREGKDVGWL